MNISPRRRRRIIREHQLRQNGRTLEDIAARLGVSVATVHADLRLLETNWNDFAQATRHDLLLQQITRVNRRIGHLLNRKPLGPEAGFTAEEFLRVETLYAQNLNAACRELRLLLRELPGDARPGSGEIIDIELADYPDYELADPEETRKNLKKAESPQHLIPGKTRESEPRQAAEKKSPENLKAIAALPRNTGRNKPCPCGSGRKRKHCHPQDSGAPLLAERSPSDSGNLPTPATGLPPGLEAEALRLTQEHHEAEQRNDARAQVRALSKLADLYSK